LSRRKRGSQALSKAEEEDVKKSAMKKPVSKRGQKRLIKRKKGGRPSTAANPSELDHD